MHTFQPKHSKLKKEESENLLKKYNINFSQLPKIKFDDPAIENMDLKSGDIVKIEKKEEGKVNTYFRVVV